MHGADNLIVEARSALLDALEALEPHLAAIVLIGAQAVYLHTGSLNIALAESTKDSDLAIDPRILDEDPRIESAMTSAKFYQNLENRQPGAWLNSKGIPVDLMVAEALAGRKSSRSARIPPHDRFSARRAAGLEAAMVDNSLKTIHSLEADDLRVMTVAVAGPAALLVAKMHKLGERQDDSGRLNDKDAHDVYRLLVAVETEDMAVAMRNLLGDDLSRTPTSQAVEYFRSMFASGPNALGSHMAGRAEEGVGSPETVSASVAFLASDLLDALE